MLVEKWGCSSKLWMRPGFLDPARRGSLECPVGSRTMRDPCPRNPHVSLFITLAAEMHEVAKVPGGMADSG